VDGLIYARAQMGVSLAFHIAFAAAGVGLPLLMVLAELMHQRTGDPDYLELSKRMAKGTSILFAVGAVSGTVLSFELGLLWPHFMGAFGGVVGLPFALEGFAFFTEAIFLGLFLYGRTRISPRLHLLSGVAVLLSGTLSAAFVTMVNACMNVPAGFTWRGGKAVDLDPIAAMFSPAWPHEALHVVLSSFEATAMGLAAIHAAVLLKHPGSTLFRKAFGLTLAVASISAVLQPLSGDLSARHVAREEPWKLAAMEGLFHTERGAALRLGGIADEATGEMRHAVEIPHGLSLLAFHDPNAEVKGLETVPRDEWPPVAKVHLSFEVMVGAGSALAALGALAALLAWRARGVPVQRWFLRAVVGAGPLGLIALEAGWLVTEWGRQPWVMHGAMRTSEAATPFPYLAAPFWLFGAIYVFLAVSVLYLLWNQLRSAPLETTHATR
jgi:cytochrome d ubiquinol oxidase subunit I